VWLALAGVTQAIDMSSILRSAAPEPWERDRVEEAITDVLHRCFFGLRPEVNAHRHDVGRPPTIPLGPALAETFARADALAREATQPDRRALASLLEVGGDVVVRRGYRGTRVDDVVDAAGVSHGAFYRYFDNKDDFVRVVAVRALAAMSAALSQLPDDPDRVPLRRWLRRYAAVHAEQAAMIRVWVSVVDELLHDDRAGVFDWGRRQAEQLLRGRTFGDRTVDALVLLGFIEAYGSRPADTSTLDAAVRVVEQAFLGREP
jgi:AcrR family transcriptional regulator